jgi:uroporphyrin-3 C-methyltransferase
MTPEPTPPQRPADPARKPWATRTSLVIAVIALAVAGSAGWVQLRQSHLHLREAVARANAAADAATAKAAAQDADTAVALRDAQAKLALLEARLAESQSQQAVLETFYRELSPSRDDLTLTEIDQTVNLAAQQLALAGNVQSALAALQVADSKLLRIDRPRFTPLRRALAADMDRLKAVPYVDVATLAIRIDGAIAAVDGLPLARDERLPARAATGDAADPRPPWRRLLADAWSRLHDVVRIESTDKPAPPLLLPSEDYFLRENLRLRLLSARNALLARNDASFKADVRAADAWVRKYFDLRAKPVQAVTATLAQLAAVAMPQTLPDLAQSLAALTTLRATQDRLSARAQDKPAGNAASTTAR